MKKGKALTATTIALINVAAISNIKNFPLLAELGLAVVPFLILSALFFFLPVSFVSAELASGWPERGVYTWVKEALGPRAGFVAIWLQWIENVIWYPTILSFIAATFAYLFDPSLAKNPTYMLVTILIAFWLATWANFFGMRVSGWISSLSALFGTILPIALIILLGIVWIVQGNPSQISFSWGGLLPDFGSLHQWVLLSGVLLGLSGIEMSAVHAKDVQDPKRDYPKGIFLSALWILVFAILGALAIAILLPAASIELASGSMDAFRLLLDSVHLSWALPLIALATTFGALGMMSTWIVGPSRGLYASALDGDLPPLFRKTNRHAMPTAILVTQGIIVTLLSLVFLFMPSVSSSYWILVALASILYQVMYILLFISAIVLRYKYPQKERIYKIPFGNSGMWCTALAGMLGSSLGLLLGFFPPAQFDTGPFFFPFLIGSVLFFCLLPLLLYSCKKWWKS